jgi:hypothetical protein
VKSGVRTALEISFFSDCVCVPPEQRTDDTSPLEDGWRRRRSKTYTHTGAPLSRIKRFHITKIIASMCEGRYGEHVTLRRERERGNLLKVALNSCHLHLN